MSLDRLWAGWRSEYVGSPSAGPGAGVAGPDRSEDACVFCRILDTPDDRAGFVVWRGDRVAAVLNAYPYTTGHLMVMPLRHVADLEDLDGDEAPDLWSAVTDGVRATKAAYRPDGINVGINIGQASGAGIPGHLHVHCLPRWSGDTNFMTAVAETRVLPESLTVTYDKLTSAWPRRRR